MKSILCALISIGCLTPLPSAEPDKPVASPVAGKAISVNDVSPDQAEKLIKDLKGLIILDVRTADEFAQGHIKGATNVDFLESDFESKVKALDPARPVLVHCASGHRSSQAVDLLRKSTKLSTIYHLKDGFHGWKAAKKPVEGGK